MATTISAAGAHPAAALTDRIPASKGPFTPGSKGYLTPTLIFALLMAQANEFTAEQGFSGTDHAGLRLLSLTTAQRDALVGAAGQFIWNTTTSRLNYYNGAAWVAVQIDSALLSALAGLTPTAQGDLIYATGVDTFAKLAKDTNATRYLSNTGASNAPLWAQIALANGVSGILPLANGGNAVALVDPNADRLKFWDDSAGEFAFLAPDPELVITGTTIGLSQALAAPTAFGAGDKFLVLEGGVWKLADFADLPGAGGGIANVIEDTTPQLGGALDANTFNMGFDDNTGITDDSLNEQLIFQKTASAVNHVEMTNAATGNDPSIRAAGDDTDVDLLLDGKGTGIAKDAAGVPYKKAGKETIATLKGTWKSKAAAPPTAVTYQDTDAWSFNGTTATRLRMLVPMPKSWNEGTVSFKVFGLVDTGGAGSNVAVWKMAAKAFSHDDPAWTTADLATGAQAANMSWTADDDILVSAESGALTIDGSPAEGDLVLFEFWRDPADAADNNTAAWLVFAIHVYYTTNAPTDA